MNDGLDSETEQASRSDSGEGVSWRCLSSFFVILRLQTLTCTKISERYDAFDVGEEMLIEGA